MRMPADWRLELAAVGGGCCCAGRVLRKNPELIEEFWDKASELLHDKNQAVCLTGATLMLAMCAMDPSMVEKYRPMVSGGKAA